jgi:hypothetical protein
VWIAPGAGYCWTGLPLSVPAEKDPLQPFASDRNTSKVACLQFMAALTLL